MDAFLDQLLANAQTATGEAPEAQVDKRRMLNALIQGAANNSQYLFNFVNDQLRDIDPDLPELYGMMISANDLNYWLFSDEMIQQAQTAGSAAGKEEVQAEGRA